MPAEPAPVWETARGPVALDRPVLMGILNVTPDSFSDGGRFTALDSALAQADALLEAGAAIVDIGGESTRPGRDEPVPEDVELARVLPVVEALVRRHPELRLTVDTVKSEVARAALGAGAAAINDVSGLRLDPGARRGRGAGSRGPRAHALARADSRDRVVRPRDLRRRGG